VKTVALRALILVAVLAAVLGVALEFVKLPDATQRVMALPEQGEGFTSTELSLDDQETGFFSATRVLKRQYKVGKHDFLLRVVDVTHDTFAVHDPLYPFRGLGWDIRSSGTFVVPGGYVLHVNLSRGAVRSEAVVWYSDGTERHASGQKQWWQNFLRKLTFGKSGEEPVLVVLQPTAEGSVIWADLFSQFPPLFSL
jgi:hypothetical protein